MTRWRNRRRGRLLGHLCEECLQLFNRIYWTCLRNRRRWQLLGHLCEECLQLFNCIY